MLALVGAIDLWQLMRDCQPSYLTFVVRPRLQASFTVNT
jgi:hypothetical protein